MTGCSEGSRKALDEPVRSSEIVIDRPKGPAHPGYPGLICRVAYG